ncbi:MAG: hypothetical protein B7Z73_04670 [Planctomycetia bacterium 21-64-5]|nr:MAG: hypothetical protein B7Z73_04670 [Planctomycetia bacterium 21-64-5]
MHYKVDDSLAVREPFPKRFLRRCLPREYFDEVQGIYLSRSKATDAELAHLAALTELTSLYLDDTQVTDAGLAHLHGLKNLERLSFSRTRATLKGRAELQRALPDCRVAGP